AEAPIRYAVLLAAEHEPEEHADDGRLQEHDRRPRAVAQLDPPVAGHKEAELPCDGDVGAVRGATGRGSRADGAPRGEHLLKERILVTKNLGPPPLGRFGSRRHAGRLRVAPT